MSDKNTVKIPARSKRLPAPYTEYFVSADAPEWEMNRAEAQVWNHCVDLMERMNKEAKT